MTRSNIVALTKPSTPVERREKPSGLEALLEAERAVKESEWFLRQVQRLNPLTTGGDMFRHMRLRHEPDEARQLAFDQRQHAPDVNAAYAVCEALHRACAEEPNEKLTTALVAQTLASIPNTKGVQDKAIYLRLMVNDIMDEGYSPSVVAAACQKIRRTLTFAPSIAEVLAVCKDRLEVYRAARDQRARHIERKLAEIHFVLHVTGGDDCEFSNRQRLAQYRHDAEAEDEAQWLHFRNQVKASVPQIESRPIAPMVIDTVSDRAEVKPGWEQ